MLRELEEGDEEVGRATMNTDSELIDQYIDRINNAAKEYINKGETPEEREHLRKCLQSDIATMNGFSDPNEKYFEKRKKEALRASYLRCAQELTQSPACNERGE